MQAIGLRIPRLGAYVAGDRFSIYVSDELGEIDYDGLPLVGDVPFWPGTRRHAGHLCEHHLCWGHIDHASPDGHLTGRHVEHGHLEPEVVFEYTTPQYYLGHRVIAVCVDDAAGNRSGSAPAMAAYTINSSPRPASDFRRARYDDVTDQVSLSFSSSPDLVHWAT